MKQKKSMWKYQCCRSEFIQLKTKPKKKKKFKHKKTCSELAVRHLIVRSFVCFLFEILFYSLSNTNQDHGIQCKYYSRRKRKTNKEKQLIGQMFTSVNKSQLNHMCFFFKFLFSYTIESSTFCSKWDRFSWRRGKKNIIRCKCIDWKSIPLIFFSVTGRRRYSWLNRRSQNASYINIVRASN